MSKVTSLLTVLRKMRTDVRNRNLGICGNVGLVNNALRTEMRTYFCLPGFFAGYPYFTGDTVWIVAHPPGGQDGPDLWSGEYGYRRYALLEYIIMRIESRAASL
jgi:hypothetical protein